MVYLNKTAYKQQGKAECTFDLFEQNDRTYDAKEMQQAKAPRSSYIYNTYSWKNVESKVCIRGKQQMYEQYKIHIMTMKQIWHLRRPEIKGLVCREIMGGTPAKREGPKSAPPDLGVGLDPPKQGPCLK